MPQTPFLSDESDEGNTHIARIPVETRQVLLSSLHEYINGGQAVSSNVLIKDLFDPEKWSWSATPQFHRFLSGDISLVDAARIIKSIESLLMDIRLYDTTLEDIDRTHLHEHTVYAMHIDEYKVFFIHVDNGDKHDLVFI